MGCHICSDEIGAIIALLAGYKYIMPWAKGLWARRHEKPNCKHPEGHHE